MNKNRRDTFDPDNLDDESMKILAEHIEEYLKFLESIMIIPEEIQEKYGDRIQVSKKRVKKLIKRLKKGDTSVFNNKINEV